MTDHQLAILGILIGAFALWRPYYSYALSVAPHWALIVSILATLLCVVLMAFFAGFA